MKNKIIYLVIALSTALAFYSCGENDNWIVIEPDIPPVREPLHLIGDMFQFENWNNANHTFVMFRDSIQSLDTYTGKFFQGSLKFISDKDLGTWDNLFGSKETGKLTQESGETNISIAADGYYTVTPNIPAMTYTITSYDASEATTYDQIGLIGAFNEWSTDVFLTKTSYDPHIWTIESFEATVDTELKFRANAGWDTNWGGRTFPYGISPETDAPNIKVPAGKYFVKFNDLTGHYIFYVVKTK